MWHWVNRWRDGNKLNGTNDYDTCRDMIDYHEIIDCIVSALDAKDPYTAGHSQRVSDMALVVCRLMHLNENEIQKIHIAAHLHDIGKEHWKEHWKEVTDAAK